MPKPGGPRPLFVAACAGVVVSAGVHAASVAGLRADARSLMPFLLGVLAAAMAVFVPCTLAYSRMLKEPQELGVLILNNHGEKLARIPNVSAGSAGPYVLRPNGPSTKPVYLIANTNVYQIEVEPFKVSVAAMVFVDKVGGRVYSPSYIEMYQ